MGNCLPVRPPTCFLKLSSVKINLTRNLKGPGEIPVLAESKNELHSPGDLSARDDFCQPMIYVLRGKELVDRFHLCSSKRG